MKKTSNNLLVILLLLLGVALIFGGKFLMDQRKISDDTKVYAVVYELTGAGRKPVKTFALSAKAKGIYEFSGILGTTVVEVDGDRVRVKSSPCLDQVCVQFGWLSLPGDFSACLPNAMMVVVEDGITFGN